MLVKEDARGRLSEAKDLFREAQAIRRDEHKRQARDLEIYWGYQWSKEQQRYLAEEGRPALVFNFVQAVGEELIGAQDEARRTVRAVPSGKGAEDRLAAEILNHAKDRLLEEAGYEELRAQVFERAIAGGSCSLSIDANAQALQPDWIELDLRVVGPFDALWDPAAKDVGNTDAGYDFVSHWLTEGEFRREYPDHWADFEQLRRQADSRPYYDELSDADYPDDLGDVMDRCGYAGDYSVWSDRRFFDHRGRIRVVHMQAKVAVRVYVVRGPGGESTWREISKAQYDRIRAEQLPLEVVETVRRELRDFIFTGATVLHDGYADSEPMLPVGDFTLLTFEALKDWERGEPHSPLRRLHDPQLEINKRASLEVDILAEQIQAKAVVEDDAVDDLDTFQSQLESRAGVGVLKSGAIAGQKWQQLSPPQGSQGARGLTEESRSMFNGLAGTAAPDLALQASAQPEAVGTAFLKYRRSMQALTSMMRRFQAWERRLARRVIELLVNSVPDSQWAALLGDAERYVFRGGQVLDRETGRQTTISNARALQYQIGLDAAEANTISAMIELQVLIQVAAASGLPIPPELIYRRLPISKDEKALAEAFFREQQAAQAQAAQRQEQVQTQLLEEQVAAGRRKDQLEAVKADRKLSADELDSQRDFAVKLVDLLLEASAGERDRVLEFLRLAESVAARQQARVDQARALPAVIAA